MKPEFQILNLTVHAYGFFLALAAATVVGGAFFASLRRGLPPARTFFCLLLTTASVLIGARLLNTMTDPAKYATHTVETFSFNLTGFSLYGGLTLGVFTGLLTCHMMRINPWRLADSVAPGLGAGIALTRLGCFFNGCCFGKTTDLPWGAHFPPGSLPYLYQLARENAGLDFFSLISFTASPVHPTQLYEMGAGIIGAFLALFILYKGKKDGFAFLSFIIWFTSFRWLNSYLRVTLPDFSAPPNFYPLLYAAVLIVSLVLLTIIIDSRAGVDGQTSNNSQADKRGDTKPEDI